MNSSLKARLRRLEHAAKLEGVTPESLLEQMLSRWEVETSCSEAKVVSLWNDIVVPVSTLHRIEHSTMVHEKIHEMGPFVQWDWIGVFNKMAQLRRLCSWPAFNLINLLCSSSGKANLIKLRNGFYDDCKGFKHSGATLTKILDGADPGDWLKCPPGGEGKVAPISIAIRYTKAMKERSPHTHEWVSRHADQALFLEMRGLLEPMKGKMHATT